MGRLWKGIRRRTAAVLIGTMVLTSFSPAAGWAASFREMMIADEDAGVEDIIHANVKAGFDSNANHMSVMPGGTVTGEYTFKVDVDVTVATAPEATSPEATAPEATAPEATAPEATAQEADLDEDTFKLSEPEAMELVAGWLEYRVDVTEASESTASLTVDAAVPNEDPLKVRVTVTAPDHSADIGKEWVGNIRLVPVLKEGAPFALGVVAIEPADMSLTVGVDQKPGGEEEEKIIPERDEIALRSDEESKGLAIRYAPADASLSALGMRKNEYGELVELDTEYFRVDGIEDTADSDSADGDMAEAVVLLTGLEKTEAELYLKVDLEVGGKAVSTTFIRVYVEDPPFSLPSDAGDEALMEDMADKLNVLMGGNASQGEKLLAADEVIAALQEIETEVLIANEGNLDEIEAALEELLGTSVRAENRAAGRVASIESVGGLLNIAPGQEGTLRVKPASTPGNISGLQNPAAIDIKLVDEKGKPIQNLKVPMRLTFGRVAGLDYNRPIRIRHIREDGSWKDLVPVVKDGKLNVWVDGYSTFVFANTRSAYLGGNGGNGTSSGGGGSAPVAGGTWQQSEGGWKYRYSNGSYAVNGWAELAYNSRTDWYHFNVRGYLDSGWYRENGHTYYLNPVHDGSFGMMATGWKEIDGKSYYFNPQTGGPKGAMLIGTVTPDGKTVGADGAMIP